MKDVHIVAELFAENQNYLFFAAKIFSDTKTPAVDLI